MTRSFILLSICTIIIILHVNKVFIYEKLIAGKGSVWPKNEEIRRINRDESIFLRQVVKTHIGYSSFVELREEVFKEFGYNLTIPTYPFVTLDFKVPVNCSWEFKDFVDQQEERSNRRPKAFIPDDETRDFLMNKYGAVSYKYFDDRKKVNMTYASWENIADIVTWHARDVLRLNDDSAAISMHHAMQYYPLLGQRGLILAADHPIVEIQAIQNGAAHILSVGALAHENNDISSVSLTEFARNHHRYTRSFDFLASYATLESIGLGRYGEVLNSGGDIQMMLMLGCSLKRGGLAFLGIPIGRDAVIFNEKRIYGHVRLPMLLAGFEWIGTFSEDNATPSEIRARDIDRLYKFSHFYRTIVLKKL